MHDAGLSPLDYLRPVWRFRWAVLALVIVAAGATYAYYDHEAKRYESATQMFVGQSNVDQLLATGGNVASDQRTLANQARLVRTPQVAARVARRLGTGVAPQALLGSVAVHPDAQADFLTITTVATTAEGAAQLADGFARAYLNLRRAATRQSAERALGVAQEQLAALPPEAPEREPLAARIAQLQGVVQSAPSVGQQVGRAVVPAEPVSPKPVRNAVFAALLALLVGIVLAYLLDRSDRRVRRVEDAEALYDAPILATIPHARRPLPKGRDGVVTVADLSESYRSLRVSLDLLRREEGLRTLMVASALPAEGKSTVVRNLAIAYREAGLRVAVLETDLRRPALATLLDVDAEPGLVEALLEQDGGANSLQRVPSPGVGSSVNGRGGFIDVLVSGVPPQDPTALLTPERLRPVLATLASSHDVLIVDSSPMLTVSDPLPLLPLVDGVVLVVRARLSTPAAAARVRRTLRRVAGARVIGTVVNDVTDDPTHYYRAARPDSTSESRDPQAGRARAEIE